jgi:hypothetical protein
MCVYIVGVEEEDESCSCASANHRCGRLKGKISEPPVADCFRV